MKIFHTNLKIILLSFTVLTTLVMSGTILAVPTENTVHGERHFTFASDKIIYGTVNYYIDVTFTIYEDYAIIHTDESIVYMPVKSLTTNYTIGYGPEGWMYGGYQNQTEMLEDFQEHDIAVNYRPLGHEKLLYNSAAISSISLVDHYRINEPILNRESSIFKTYIISAPPINTILEPGTIYKKIREQRINVTDPQVYYRNFFHEFEVTFYDGSKVIIPSPEDRVWGLGDFHTLYPRNSTIKLNGDIVFSDLPHKFNTEEWYGEAELEQVKQEIEASFSERLYEVDALESTVADLEQTLIDQTKELESYSQLQQEYDALSISYEELEAMLEETSKDNSTQIPGFPPLAIVIGLVILMILTKNTHRRWF